MGRSDSTGPTSASPTTRTVAPLILSSGPEGGTDLRWTLHVEEPAPGPALVGHLCKRLNQLINAELRCSFGQ